MVRYLRKLCAVLVLPIVFLNCDKSRKNTQNGKEPAPSPHTSVQIEVLTKDLKYPWGMALLPNGDLLFTEREGKLHLLKKGSSSPSLLTTRQVQQNSEGGLLGLAVDPDFNNNHHIYIYETAESNRVVRFILENDQLGDEKVITDGIPKAGNHDGGVILFGPDGYLYIGTGDAQEGNLSQNKNSLAGKILRITKDGQAAPGNPFNSAIYAYGLRNVQGLCWTEKGQLYATDHGPSGEKGWCCHDELNLIKAGANYGWPEVIGDTKRDTLEHPVVHSGKATWAPSGCAYTGENGLWPGEVVVACLRGSKLARFSLNTERNNVTSQSDTLENSYGRIRNIIRGGDGSLIFCTSNGDDGIYLISRKSG